MPIKGAVSPRSPIASAVLGVLACLVVGACKKVPEWERGKKFIHYGVRGKVGTFEPVRQATVYAGKAQAQVYETLYTYKYLVRPLEVEPLLAASMPEVSDDLLTYTIDIKRGVLFHNDKCFPGGKGREMVADDVRWSIMRMADLNLQPQGWWIFQNRIVGFDDFQKRMNDRKKDAPFDWKADIEGIKVLSKYQLQFKLSRPFPQFLYILSMGYSSVVPRECSDFYGNEFGNHAVGTGPFILKEWTRGSRIIYLRNPTYRDERYPSEAADEFKKRGMLEAAGKRIPFVDGLVLHVTEQDQAMWLKFRVQDLDFVQVPAEYQNAIFKEDWTLRDEFVQQGMGNHNLPLLDYIYRGFNMDDPVVGQGDKARYLRQAMALAVDTKEINETFYNGTAITYDGPVPPGLDGYKKGFTSPYRFADRKKALAKARGLMTKAGYPYKKGKTAVTLAYHSSRGGNSVEQAEMYSRQLREIGIELDVHITSFPILNSKLKKRKAQMFGLAWSGDYPDAENFLQLFYGPNETPGSNNFNYHNAEYDKLFAQTGTMFPSPERTEIYQRMRAMIIEDSPAIGNMARIRFYVWNKRLKNLAPSETWYRWYKYLDISDEGVP